MNSTRKKKELKYVSDNDTEALGKYTQAIIDKRGQKIDI